MSKFRIISNKIAREALITGPDVFPGILRFSVPEFQAEREGKMASVDQELSWSSSADFQRIDFKASSTVSDTPIAFQGSLQGSSDNVCEMQAEVSNLGTEEIKACQHSLVLDSSGAPTLQDHIGKRTVVFTDQGWCPVDRLVDLKATPKLSVGSTYEGHTIIWKLVGVVDEHKKVIMAFAVDRGVYFSWELESTHKRLTAACAWGALKPQESKKVTAKIYFTRQGITQLQEFYNRDFK